MRSLVVFPSRELLYAASLLSGEVAALAFSQAEAEAAVGRAHRVYIAEVDPAAPEAVAEAVLKAVEGRDVVLLPATKNARAVGGIVAQRIGAEFITDVTSLSVEGGVVKAERPAFGNKAVATIEAGTPVVLSISPGRFAGEAPQVQSAVEKLAVQAAPAVKVVSVQEKPRGSLRLEEAEVIVAVGRGFKRREDLQLAFQLAEALGGKVGCSRPIAADLKWLPEEHWVGLSGKKVKPKLYIAVGISGQPQHIAGMINSRVVVAINTDPSAPIFQYADYGVVEDLYKILPLLVERLKKR
ncbi:electron transfer flavoprotein subunit alpha/FixB family protein [Pyrobaculum neutrophilum]|uniref:Electron transfer flavoprotein alpha subunit n=1 Tax=Pyrobaculum neutrophilum (strain DSM 2338 / JCM 9278 / NBRC 100436 / V24Sta) TaxID=444157 RepID=B1YDI9_PYRNV|nr:electron transfer flavoprotein subunit alpha/FixB family protein [Pyrobaculum neutrophilum]ACB39852.1 Electron transfer flavoprotein alpha subunit [Pyrobaculum neutrophilum V24Sta]